MPLRPLTPLLAADATLPEGVPQAADTPQSLYDAHGWWAQQEEAEREEASRQAQARAAAEAPSGDPADAGDPASRPDGRPAAEGGRTATQPNPAVISRPDDEAPAQPEQDR